MPISDQGYIRPTYDDILADRISLAQELFGEDIDTSNASPLGKFIRLSVQDLADAYEAQEISYYSRFPHTATGQSLDRLMPFAAITRNPATRSEHEIIFTGTPEYEIPVGFLVGTSGDEEFYLINSVILDENGSGTGRVQCTELGTVGNVALGDIAEIINPDANVESIQHSKVIALGEDTESDVDLRKRFTNAITGSGAASAASIKGAVMRVTGITSCIVLENDGNTTSEDGLPPHSFKVFVHGTTYSDQDVGNAIFEKKPLGIKSVGDVSVEVTDISGDKKTVYFSRVADTSLHIRITVAINNQFELDGVEQIKTSLVNYINSLSSGENVIFTSLYKYIYGVAGVKDVTALAISTNGSTFSSENIILNSGDVATVDIENITVEVIDYVDE